MGKFTLVLFPDEKRALQGFSALEGLHRERSISLRGAVLVERGEDGLLLLRKCTDETLPGNGLSAVVARIPNDVLEFLARDLAPNTFALVAEGEWLSPIDAHMERFGGRVAREWCADAGDAERRTAREPRTTSDGELGPRRAAARSSLGGGGRRQ